MRPRRRSSRLPWTRPGSTGSWPPFHLRGSGTQEAGYEAGRPARLRIAPRSLAAPSWGLKTAGSQRKPPLLELFGAQRKLP